MLQIVYVLVYFLCIGIFICIFIVMTQEEFQWFCKEFNYTCIVYVIVVLLYLYSMFSDVFALVSVIYVCIVGSPEGGCHSASASVFAKDQ